VSENQIDLVPALVILAQAGIPTDIQELLVAGNPMKGIAPGALERAILAERDRCYDLVEIEMLINLSDRIPADAAKQVLAAIRSPDAH
jgi:hypothetical protein